ncbi:related to LIM homeobox protein [Rhynchosporium secalis]|uniref:Related to LIM homeobox protein n=1 Tax=Rhynchosporium secalis TaxID=38038 RepID=A0A1E1MLD8_RHYSE|nr:related to LIM homeobox protein [Rhynchosporium secalis]
MSDATLPPPRRLSSAAPPRIERSQSDSTSGEGEFETCLGQSAGYTVKGERLEESEGRSDNKQKRKRTSPADQAILEAEYKQNPKPNKAARADIVEKVFLNEKEVQIWFQNRRQINRRKSRPLLPHEIAAFGLGGMATLSSDPASMGGYSSSPNMEDMEANSQAEVIAIQHESDRTQAEVPEMLQSMPGQIPVEAEKKTEVEIEPFMEETVSTLPPPLLRRGSSAISLPESSSMPRPDTAIKSFSSTSGYLSNRWNPYNSSFSSPSSSHAPAFTTPVIFKAPQPNSCPERIDETVSSVSSNVRLSMSLDGKAELISTTPSPPRRFSARPTSSSSSMLPHRRMGLQRSQSAITFGPRPTMAHSGSSLMPRLPTGRSRDARTWETCCDGEVRDELTKLAENESHGSAVAAISLIRSSSKTALKVNSNKRNAPALKHDLVKQGKKQKLGRAMSSLARLQNTSKPSSKESQDPSGYTKDGLLRSPSGDSDKENWLPREGGGNPRRRPLPAGRSNTQPQTRAILSENNNITSHADFGGNRNRKRKPKVEHAIFEDSENSAKAGEEVEKFMRGEVSPSKKGDLDCIQGLLSLSQGNWR